MVNTPMEPGTRVELREGHAGGRTLARWVLVAAGCIEGRATTLAVLVPDEPGGAPRPCRYLVLQPPHTKPAKETPRHAQHPQAGTPETLGCTGPRRAAEVGLRPFSLTQA